MRTNTINKKEKNELRDKVLSKSFAAKLAHPWDHMGDGDEEWNQPGQRPSYVGGALDNRSYAERTKIFPIKRSKNKDED